MQNDFTVSREKTVCAQYILTQHRISEKTYTTSTGCLFIEDGIVNRKATIKLEGSSACPSQRKSNNNNKRTTYEMEGKPSYTPRRTGRSLLCPFFLSLHSRLNLRLRLLSLRMPLISKLHFT